MVSWRDWSFNWAETFCAGNIYNRLARFIATWPSNGRHNVKSFNAAPSQLRFHSAYWSLNFSEWPKGKYFYRWSLILFYIFLREGRRGVSTRLDRHFMAAFACEQCIKSHEQCIKANEQYFVSVNSNQKLFFYYFQFSVK